MSDCPPNASGKQPLRIARAPGNLPRRLSRLFDHFILITGALIMSLPVLVIFMSSTWGGGRVSRDGLQITPGDKFFEVYGGLFSGEPVFSGLANVYTMLGNTLAIALGFTLLKTLVSLLAAYGLVYFRPRWGSLWFGLIVLTMWFPVETRFLPTFLVTQKLGLLNTYAGVVLPLVATGYGTLLFHQYFRTVPDELLEAAKMDGVGPMRFLWQFLVPISVPMITALFVIFFVMGWNQYFWPILIATSSEGMITLVHGIQRAGTGDSTGMALAIVALLPPAVLVIVLQRFIVREFVAVTH